MSKRADKELLKAVLEPRKPGALRKIGEACEAGADVNGIVPECSTSTGYVRGGSTLLTHAIHEWSSNAVEKLLGCGADPDLADQNGWTPWMASTLVDESKRDRIQRLLSEYDADKTGEHIGGLTRAIGAGNVDEAAALIESERDLEILANFRVDLVGHQIRMKNAPMLELLLERGMAATSTHLLNAVRAPFLPAVDLLLRHGVAPEDADDNETPLMTAAAMGELDIVKRLVEGGADVDRSADGNIEWTASFYATNAGKKQVADWLISQMSTEVLDEQKRIMEARDPRFRKLYENATAGEGLSTDDIVEVLKRWDEKYGVSVSNVASDTVTIKLSSIPEDVVAFCAEAEKLCPEVAEDKDEFEKAVGKKKSLTLWWD